MTTTETKAHMPDDVDRDLCAVAMVFPETAEDIRAHISAQAEKIAELEESLISSVSAHQVCLDEKNEIIVALQEDNKRLREAALSRSIEVTSYRSALMQIKSAQERYVYGEVSPGVPAYKMLEAWQIADKALTQTDRKENE